MTRLNLLLLAVLLGSCLLLVKSVYESRRLFHALDRARHEQQQLDTEFKRLESERRTQATHLRVEQVARDKLRMRTATAAVTQYVEPAVPVAEAAMSTAAVVTGASP